MENYIKIIFKNGSIIIRNCIEYKYDTELMLLYFKRKEHSKIISGEIDIFRFETGLGKFIKIKTNNI